MEYTKQINIDSVLGDPLDLDTLYGKMIVRHFQLGATNGVLIYRSEDFKEPVAVRVQSSCLFGESLRSNECDCAIQLKKSLQIILDRNGLLVYLYEEGRGAGLNIKIKGMLLQKKLSCTSFTAYEKLGIPADPRDFKVASIVLQMILSDRPIILLTDYREKADRLIGHGLNIVGTQSLQLSDNKHPEFSSNGLKYR